MTGVSANRTSSADWEFHSQEWFGCTVMQMELWKIENGLLFRYAFERGGVATVHYVREIDEIPGIIAAAIAKRKIGEAKNG